MSDIDKLAREIAVDVCTNWEVSPLTQEGAIACNAARLGILEGSTFQDDAS